MKVEVFKEAQEAYAKGDYKAALEGFIACTKDVAGLAPADLSKFYHLIGNCYVKSNDPRSAAEYYLKALTGSPEKRKPSLYVNLGTALLGTKDYENALEAFGRALDYPIYTTPYKAYAGIGAAQLKLGNMVEAGAAYREAALDPANPAPAKSLVNLGVCFMELGRPEDAVSVYETALDFDLDDRARAKAYANLGQAYMAQGRVPRALEAFETAQKLGGELPSLAMHDYEIARTFQSRIDEKMPGLLDTGYIPPVASDSFDATEDPNFDPFAPQSDAADQASGLDVIDEHTASAGTDSKIPIDTAALDAVQATGSLEAVDPSMAQTVAMEPIVAPAPDATGQDTGSDDGLDDIFATFDEANTQASGYDSGLDETPFNYSEQPGYEYGVSFDFGDEYADAVAPDPMDSTEVHMPSPEDTAFFDISEQQINRNAKAGKRKNRKARGCGLKIAITLVVICILIAAAACVAYVLGYGYPLQETVTEEFFAAVQSDEDASQYWASDVSASMQHAQEASLTGITSYSVDAVQRSMSQSAVFVGATLEQGGHIDYEVVLTRNGISWAIEYVQLYFPSEQ